MSTYFPRVVVTSFVIMLTSSFLTSAEAAETAPLPELPTLVEPGTENNTIPFSGDNQSTAVLRKKAQLTCANAMEAAGEAKKVMETDRPTRADQIRGKEEYRLAYDNYMRLKELCTLSTKALNERLAAEDNGNQSTAGFDPTDPLTAQWAGTWNVEKKYLYGLGRPVHSSQLKVKISREGCEVTFEKENRDYRLNYIVEKGYNCRVRGRTLTFYYFYENDKENRVDYVFLHSGLTLKGEFGGIIYGKPAGGRCTGGKAGY